MKRQPALAASSRVCDSSLAERGDTPMDGPVRKPVRVSLTALDTSEALPTDASTLVGARQIRAPAGFSWAATAAGRATKTRVLAMRDVMGRLVWAGCRWRRGIRPAAV